MTETGPERRSFVHVEDFLIRCNGWWVQTALAARMDVLPWARMIRQFPENCSILLTPEGYSSLPIDAEESNAALDELRTPRGLLSRPTFLESEPAPLPSGGVSEALASPVPMIEVLDAAGRAWLHNRQAFTLPNLLHDLEWMIDEDGTLFGSFAGEVVIVLVSVTEWQRVASEIEAEQ